MLEKCLYILQEVRSITCFRQFIYPFFYHNEPHLQHQPPKHKIKEKFTALIQNKTRYKDPYLQPEECRGKNNKQRNKLLNEKS